MGRPRYAPLSAFAITSIEQQENYKKLAKLSLFVSFLCAIFARRVTL